MKPRKMMNTEEKKRVLRIRRELFGEFCYLGVFVAELYYQKGLHHLSAEMREARARKFVQVLLGGPDGLGVLQYVLEARTGGILRSLKEDFPVLSGRALLVFSYTAAGLPNRLVRHLADVSCENAVSVIRTRLRNRIESSHAARKAEYLELLSKKGCRFGEEMLYLHDTKLKKQWKL